jgi:hypothetical protein
MSLWNPCANGDGYFDQSVSVPYFQYVSYEPVYGTIDLSLVTHESICSPSYQSGTCARSMLGVLGPLLLKKVMYAPLFSALEPLVVVATASALRRYRRWRGGGHYQLTTPPTPPTPPDPMRRLVWFETALVFGGLVPLLLPLLALQLHTDAEVFGWILRRNDDSGGNTAAAKPVLRPAMLAHSVLVLAMHSLLAAFFFVDSELHGAAGLVAALAVIWVAFAMSMCWEIPMLDVVRCRLRPQRERIGHGSAASTAFFRDPFLLHLRDSQILEERRGLMGVLCVIVAAGFGVWGLCELLLR